MFGIDQLKTQYIDKHQILDNQTDLFKWEMGVSPSKGVRLLSPFRIDKDAGCRFIQRNGIWYFVDNAGYRGKVYFDIISLVQYKYNFSLKETFNYLRTLLIENNWYKPKHLIGIKDSRDKKEFYCRILVVPNKWEADNYFTRDYDLPIDFLQNQRLTPVKKYWVNTHKLHSLRMNYIYNPKKVETFSIYYYSKNSKLYFPNQEYRFYSNGNKDDIIPILVNDSAELFLTSSLKDAMVLSYHYNKNTVALFNEQIGGDISNELLKLIYQFNDIKILLDNDEAGYKSAEFFKQRINVLKSITKYSLNCGKDISESYKKYKHIWYSI